MFRFHPIERKKMAFNKDNYWKETIFAECSAVSRPARAPDHITDQGTFYWYSDAGLIRLSERWGNVNGSHWEIKNQYVFFEDGDKISVGFVDFEDFLQIIGVSYCGFIRWEHISLYREIGPEDVVSEN